MLLFPLSPEVTRYAAILLYGVQGLGFWVRARIRVRVRVGVRVRVRARIRVRVGVRVRKG